MIILSIGEVRSSYWIGPKKCLMKHTCRIQSRKNETLVQSIFNKLSKLMPIKHWKTFLHFNCIIIVQ